MMGRKNWLKRQRQNELLNKKLWGSQERSKSPLDLKFIQQFEMLIHADKGQKLKSCQVWFELYDQHLSGDADPQADSVPWLQLPSPHQSEFLVKELLGSGVFDLPPTANDHLVNSNDSEVPSGNSPTFPLCSKSLLREVASLKAEFEAIPHKQFRYCRAVANPFEGLGKAHFVNRSAMKMANLDVLCKLLPCSNNVHSKEPFRFVDLCGGPGGFSEYLMWRRYQQQGLAIEGWGISLIGENEQGPGCGWKIDLPTSDQQCQSGEFRPMEVSGYPPATPVLHSDAKKTFGKPPNIADCNDGSSVQCGSMNKERDAKQDEETTKKAGKNSDTGPIRQVNIATEGVDATNPLKRNCFALPSNSQCQYTTLGQNMSNNESSPNTNPQKQETIVTSLENESKRICDKSQGIQFGGEKSFHKEDKSVKDFDSDHTANDGQATQNYSPKPVQGLKSEITPSEQGHTGAFQSKSPQMVLENSELPLFLGEAKSQNFCQRKRQKTASGFVKTETGVKSKDFLDTCRKRMLQQNEPLEKSPVSDDVRGKCLSCKFQICSGKDGTGDLYKKENVEHFVHQVLTESSNLLIDLVVGDGGFTAARNQYEQEPVVAKLFLSQILVMYHLVKPGGHFACKLFEAHRPLTIGLLLLLRLSFKSFTLLKPVTSRPASGERYVICKEFCMNDSTRKLALHKLSVLHNNTQECFENLSSCLKMTAPSILEHISMNHSDFLKFVRSHNDNLLLLQKYSCSKILFEWYKINQR